MATRPRTPTYRTQPSVRRVYETLQPSSDMKETPEAFLLHVYLPGFTRDRIKITFVGSSRVVKITGERPIQGNRWVRFDKTYPVPENCQAEALQGKLDMGTLILTMPKKSISHVAPKPQVNSTPERRSSPLDKLAVTEENAQKSQETIPPQHKTTTKLEEQNRDKKNASVPSPMKGPSELNAKKATLEEDTSSQRLTESQKPEGVKGSRTSNPPEPIRDISPQKSHQGQTVKRPGVTGKPQKGKEEFEARQNSAMTTTIQRDDEKPRKRKEEEVEQKLTLAAVARDQAAEKREDEIKLKARLEAMKKQLQENTEVSGKERISREITEQEGKSSESRKPAMNTEEKGIFKEKEIKTRKMSPKEAEPSAPKVHREKDKESRSTSDNMIDILGNGIRELASSASHVVTRITEGKLNDEEKYLVVNMGAAVLVIAILGAYVSSKFGGA